MERLTTTSYAILGQLALRPRTTYELATEMHRNMRYFWPRAESLIYAEVKRLARLGLAAAAHSYTGRRRTTTYSVTPEGEAALQEWLSTPPQPAALEFEALLRVLLAPLGTTEQLLAALEAARADAEELLTFAEGIQMEYLERRAPFQGHAVTRAHMHDFLIRYGRIRFEWAEQALAEVRAWAELPPEEREQRAMRIFASTPLPREHLLAPPPAEDDAEPASRAE
jgi:DNA-binding PadR family transcriptional regulator